MPAFVPAGKESSFCLSYPTCPADSQGAAGLTLRWNGVNSDDENSGEALDGDTSIGRVYRAHNRDARQWSMYAVRPRLDLNFTRWGEVASKEEGKRRVEEAYAELLRRAEGATAARTRVLDLSVHRPSASNVGAWRIAPRRRALPFSQRSPCFLWASGLRSRLVCRRRGQRHPPTRHFDQRPLSPCQRNEARRAIWTCPLSSQTRRRAVAGALSIGRELISGPEGATKRR